MMADTPYFSIITPTYNRATFLEEMIASVAAQTFQDFEHIIVDDGSTDETEALVKRLMETDPRIVYIKQENKGRSTARNVGIDRANGEYICLLDSDDVWLPNHLEVLKVATSKQDVPAMFHTGLIWFYEDGTPDHLVQYADRNSFSSDVEYAIANQFAPDCVCIHQSILKKERFHPDLFINEDLELWSRIASADPIISVEHHTAKLRVHGGNTDKEVKDNISPRIDVFSKILANPRVSKNLSPEFIRNKKRSLMELQIRHLESVNQRWALVGAIASFLLKYPKTPRNSAKFVTMVYNLPGGGLLKSLIAQTRRRHVQ